MKTINKLTILALFLITIFQFYPNSGNVMDSDDEIDIELKEEWKGYERTVEIQLSKDQLKIDSILKIYKNYILLNFLMFIHCISINSAKLD